MKEGFVEGFQTLLNNCDLDYEAADFIMRMFFLGAGIGLGLGLVFFSFSFEFFLLVSISSFAVFEIFVYAVLVVTSSKRVALIEESLPDFLSYVASNIRGSITYDRALLLSARKEFGPLGKEVDRAAKEALTGKPFSEALISMTERIRSDVFAKTIRLIVEGVNSGGNVSDLLENTALDIRKFSATRKEVSATVLIYQLFVFAAAAIGAPMLYAVTSFLVTIVAETKQKITFTSTEGAADYLPFFKGAASAISPELVFWFALAAIAVTSFFGALAAGVISKGEESEGIPYLPIVFTVSFAVFFLTRFLLGALLGGLFISQ